MALFSLPHPRGPLLPPIPAAGTTLSTGADRRAGPGYLPPIPSPLAVTPQPIEPHITWHPTDPVFQPQPQPPTGLTRPHGPGYLPPIQFPFPFVNTPRPAGPGYLPQIPSALTRPLWTRFLQPLTNAHFLQGGSDNYFAREFRP
jgi:hypothetical protein